MVEVITKKHKNPLRFEYCDKFKTYIWKDIRGNIYSIQNGPLNLKPIWIGKLIKSKRIWITYERELRAVEALFPFGSYRFGR